MTSKFSLSELGICSTCNHVDICTSQENWIGPKIHCEEFDDSDPQYQKSDRDAQSFNIAPATSPKIHDRKGPYKGLCVNCDAREYCTLQTSDRVDRVVWHCEEWNMLPLSSFVPESLLPPFGVKRYAVAKGSAGTEPFQEDIDIDDIVNKCDEHDTARGGLSAILDEIQSVYGYLPEKAMRLLAEKTHRSLVDIYGIATFYSSFSLKPRGKHLVSVCFGTACYVRGAASIVDEFQRQLGAKPGETTPDGEFTLETVNCLGACALGPIVVRDKHYFSRVKMSKVKRIAEEAVGNFDEISIEADPRFFPVEVRCARCEHSLMDPNYIIDGHPSVHLTASFEDRSGWTRLSCLYGSYAVESEHDIPLNAVVDFCCPQCQAELTGVTRCPDCDSPMVRMLVNGGGMVEICARRGCKSHKLDLTIEGY
jgi:NADH:ubiquinone oxidoreductase subunit E